jgi:ribosomal-protein-alanine N-acetyltransferase
MLPDAFHTSRLTFRPIAPADAGPIFDAYAQDPEVTRFLTWRPHKQIEDTETYIASCLAATTSHTYVLVTRHSDTLIGAFDLRPANPWCLGYGYVLARSAWGQGLMTEVLKEVATRALSEPEIWRIGDVCDVENHASARVMEKAGFQREGVLTRWSLHPNISNEPRDCISFAKVKTAP